MSHQDKTASLLMEGVAFTLLFALLIVVMAIIDNPGVSQ
jgi:hypothetical protein